MFLLTNLSDFSFFRSQAHAAACHTVVVMKAELDGHDLFTMKEWKLLQLHLKLPRF